ncbi:MAG: hypothetical protein KKG12_13150 [Gammaproteobacteria bacterium]|nr:hypothetical protein [Gammaproteobacteria bacterium]
MADEKWVRTWLAHAHDSAIHQVCSMMHCSKNRHTLRNGLDAIRELTAVGL